MSTMALIYETDNFIIESAEYPFISREEGGHMRILPKVTVSDRTKLSPALAIEYMKLSMVCGEALVHAMAKQGIDIGIVNYQDMGNWRVHSPEGLLLHMHILGRAKTAVIQKYGQGVQLPPKGSDFYKPFKELTEEDRELVKTEIERLLASEKYKNW